MRNKLLLLLNTFLLFQLSARDIHPFNEEWFFKKAESLPAGINENWLPVTIPHTWNATDMQVRKNAYYAGIAYYKKEYTPDQALADKRIFLRFQGVGAVADVYVNGSYVNSHKGAYSAFVVEITRALNFGKTNEIVVKVDNAPKNDIVPVNNTLFGVYGGIYRPVELIITDKLSITVSDYASSGIYISQKDVSPKSAEVSVKIKLENKYLQARKASVITTIYEKNGRVKDRISSSVDISPQGRQVFVQKFNLKNPHLWQGLEDPYLYRVETELISDNKKIDKVVQSLGVRHFELKTADGMYLNGKKVPMYGVCRHQDWWKQGSALSDKEHDADLAMMKEIGATTIRFAHYQQAEYIYAKCDSIGFIVWAEIPFVNRVTTKEGDNAKQQLLELIRQNYNHPSIYIWGLHNEVYTPYDYNIALTTDLNELAKTEDPDRYTVSVSGYSKVDQTSNLNADVQGINHYFGWYNGEIGDVEKWVAGMETNFPDFKMMMSEYGAEANVNQQEEKVGNVGRYFSQFYPETFATKFHEIHWGVISKHPYLLASYVWNMFDFATPATTQGGVEARNMKGLVTFDRKIKKDPFYWYKANWSKEPVLYLTQRRAKERENQVTPVVIYSNIGVPRLFVNGTERRDYKLGTTSVHYIFNDIPLQEGENVIEARCVKEGKEYTDKIVWHYDSCNKRQDPKSNEPVKKTTEHIGL